MEATEILMSEHRVIERVISSLEIAASRLEKQGDMPAEFFIDAASFIAGFADGCHHRKEEGVLFKEMAANGMPVQSGPIAVMLAEHEQGRRFTRGMREAAVRLQAGDPQAQAAVVQNARNYAALLRQHIQKEDNILFPMADRFIPVDLHEQVLHNFEQVEQDETGPGVREKYLALANQLEKAVGS